MIETPVLFITFARSEYARKSFDAIKRVKPKKLYFYSNKGRESNIDEYNNNELIRSYAKEVDWDCELKLFFRETYVDVYTSLFSAIDWVFSNEDKAIILEEDCVASEAFFTFCQTLLVKYQNDKRIWIISGDNFTPLPQEIIDNKPDYYISKFPHIYGWASWKDRWFTIDRDMTSWTNAKKEKVFYQYYGNSIHAKNSIFLYEKLYKKIEHTKIWDYLFEYSRIINNAYGIVPKLNLVSNIGVSGIHNNKIKYFNNFPTYNFDFTNNIKHPNFIFTDLVYDYHHYKIHISPRYRFGRFNVAINMLKDIIKGIILKTKNI